MGCIETKILTVTLMPASNQCTSSDRQETASGFFFFFNMPCYESSVLCKFNCFDMRAVAEDVPLVVPTMLLVFTQSYIATLAQYLPLLMFSQSSLTTLRKSSHVWEPTL